MYNTPLYARTRHRRTRHIFFASTTIFSSSRLPEGLKLCVYNTVAKSSARIHYVYIRNRVLYNFSDVTDGESIGGGARVYQIGSTVYSRFPGGFSEGVKKKK